VFIVRGKRREPEAAIGVVKTTRKDALDAALDFFGQRMPLVNVVGDGRTYTPSEFPRPLGGA
jgi:hypothetical protein